MPIADTRTRKRPNIGAEARSKQRSERVTRAKTAKSKPRRKGLPDLPSWKLDIAYFFAASKFDEVSETLSSVIFYIDQSYERYRNDSILYRGDMQNINEIIEIFGDNIDVYGYVNDKELARYIEYQLNKLKNNFSRYELGLPLAARNELTDDGLGDEGDISKPESDDITLRLYLSEERLPSSCWPEAIKDIKRVVKKHLVASKPRTLWKNRGQDPELADLSAPEFLKRVWADQIGPDGTIERALVAERDPKLLINVSTYISEREGRGAGLGAAEGLRLLKMTSGRPKRATLG